MARMPYGPTGPIIGKVRSIVGVMGKTGPYIRAVARKRTDKPSPAQKLQRSSMAAVTSFLYSMRDLIAITFYEKEDNRIPWNKAVSCNVKNAVYTAGTKQKLRYNAAIVSQGSLPNAFLPAARVSAPGTISFLWEDNSGTGNARTNDNAILVVYCEAAKRCAYITKGASRSAKTDTIQAPYFKGKLVQTWLGFISAAGQEVAPSIYTGELTL
jgi:hypothetical protein